MKQNIFKIVLSIVVILIVTFIIFGGVVVVRSAFTNDDLWAIANELNWQRTLKQKCLDNLTYEESRQSILWFTKPCVQYDERIMELKAELDSYLVKDYMKPAGLAESRQAQQ
jgi:hypothetical protein